MRHQKYIQAVKDLAKHGKESGDLFIRVSDQDLMRIVNQMQTDKELVDAIKHENCVGLVDTFLLSVTA